MATPSLPVEAPVSRNQHPSDPVIVFEDVSIAFEENVVLDGISFTLPYGETKAIFGVAGSGKSTILKMALGLVKPDSGHIYTMGEDVTHMTEDQLFELRRNVGIVFQESALFDSLTVRQNVAFRLIEEGETPAEEIERRVREALRFVELENTVDMFPSELSGGMRRRVAIARAIISRPETLLYDSPTGGLDPVTSTTIVELIVKQRDVSKTSSLLVTHRLQDAFVMANHYFDAKAGQMKLVPPGGKIEAPMAFLMLREGKIIFDGNIEELAHTKNEYIREYIS
jgi:phospholipid/cholesterol/gamma-HCH transport system ATP-binding protein